MAVAVQHRYVKTNGIRLHFVERGSGPLVLLLHGFPEFWYSWRHQIPALAGEGYRVIAPDMRGYGESEAPEGIQNYTHFDIVGDLVGLLDHLNEKQAFVVGHDWGAMIAWSFCLLRPDRVKALVALSVPFSPRRAEVSPVQRFEKLLGEGFYYCRFQETGRAEADFARHGTRHVLRALMAPKPGPMIAPKDKELMDVLLPRDDLPSWLTEEDLDYYVEQYEKSGFTPPLNYYRATDISWKLSAPWTEVGIQTPTLFITGEKDLVYHFPGTKSFVHRPDGLRKYVPNLKEVVVIPGTGHFMQQQSYGVVNELLLKFLRFIQPSSRL